MEKIKMVTVQFLNGGWFIADLHEANELFNEFNSIPVFMVIVP